MLGLVSKPTPVLNQRYLGDRPNPGLGTQVKRTHTRPRPTKASTRRHVLWSDAYGRYPMTLGTARDVQNEGTERAKRARGRWCTKAAPHRIGVDRRTPHHPL